MILSDFSATIDVCTVSYFSLLSVSLTLKRFAQVGKGGALQNEWLCLKVLLLKSEITDTFLLLIWDPSSRSLGREFVMMSVLKSVDLSCHVMCNISYFSSSVQFIKASLPDAPSRPLKCALKQKEQPNCLSCWKDLLRPAWISRLVSVHLVGGLL